MPATIYARVSHEDQAQSGNGINAQTDACHAYAARNNLEVVGIFKDEGVSGSLGLEKRPALLEAIAALRRGDVLLVAKRDRVGRLDPMKLTMIEAAVQRKGARIVSVAGEGTESDDPTAILMRRMIDAFAEYERLVIGARTKAALGAKARRGERVGQIPYGLDLGDDGKNLIPNAAEQHVVATVWRLRSEGMSMQKIANHLNAAGIPTKGKGRWHLMTVQRILKDRRAA